MLIKVVMDLLVQLHMNPEFKFVFHESVVRFLNLTEVESSAITAVESFYVVSGFGHP